MIYWEQGKKLQLNKGSKYLCSLLNCTETELYYNTESEMWVTDTMLYSEDEVNEWVEDNCMYIVELTSEN